MFPAFANFQFHKIHLHTITKYAVLCKDKYTLYIHRTTRWSEHTQNLLECQELLLVDNLVKCELVSELQARFMRCFTSNKM